MIDAGDPFVKTTYTIEGDGPLAFTCYEVLSTLAAGIRVQHFPNLEAVAREISGGTPAIERQWVNYGKACVAVLS